MTLMWGFGVFPDRSLSLRVLFMDAFGVFE
jgi:hypothetical protein